MCVSKSFWQMAFIHVLIGCSIDGLFATNLMAKCDEFAADSWKTKIVDLNGTRTIEQHLVRIFNSIDWRGKTAQKINKDIPYNIRAFYYGAMSQPNPKNWIELLEENPEENLSVNDSPRQWMRKLNLREICRFKAFVDNALSVVDHHTDDLVIARSLCGIFWFVNTQKKTATSWFSGMLVPNQIFADATYKVYTCMHGFDRGNYKENNIEYYFVPYGLIVEDYESSDVYVAKKGLKVTRVHQGGAVDRDIEDGFFSATNPRSANNTSTDITYHQNDYAVATIERQTIENKSLRDILVETGLGIVDGTSPKLPIINTDGTVNIAAEFDSSNERLFVIGLAAYDNFADKYGFAISTTLRNEGFANTPRRSIKNDGSEKKPKYIEAIAHEYSSSLATFSGMSGGPVLRCRLNSVDANDKRCEFIGTVFGAERIFTAGTDALAGSFNSPQEVIKY
ncbi:hypothetical protein FACS1894122_14050 [Alphaproteobacteria bacterium]|nr:hypothetical protein FACS1894122_14050 [Alphaproteobacteria bacterium]